MLSLWLLLLLPLLLLLLLLLLLTHICCLSYFSIWKYEQNKKEQKSNSRGQGKGLKQATNETWNYKTCAHARRDTMGCPALAQPNPLPPPPPPPPPPRRCLFLSTICPTRGELVVGVVSFVWNPVRRCLWLWLSLSNFLFFLSHFFDSSARSDKKKHN